MKRDINTNNYLFIFLFCWLVVGLARFHMEMCIKKKKIRKVPFIELELKQISKRNIKNERRV